MGHDISLTGLSFTHEEPLAERKVAVSFLFDDGPLDSVVTLLRWCRFRRDGFYQTGGLFLRAIALGDEATLSDRTALGDGACALPGPLSQGTPAY